MAVYSINRNGVESMQTLKTELEQAVNDIFEISLRLDNNITSMESGLSIYYDLIKSEIKEVLQTLKKASEGDDGVGFLINTKLPKMISDMERLIDAGLGDDESPQKNKTLRR